MSEQQEQTTEIEEFVELVGTSSVGNNESSIKKTGNSYDDDDDDYIEKPKGDTTQWVNVGNDNFTASGDTVKELPPGIYKAVLTPRGSLNWAKLKIHNDELIRLPDTASDRVIESIRVFWEAKPKFRLKRQLFKRGVLLWGPPGSGKTATVMQLMDELVRKGGIVLVVSNPTIATEALRQLRVIEPKRPIISVLEDLDELVDAHGEAGILALLDGEAQVDNIVHIATTNYPERLDARIINRPSRFDEVIKVGMPTAEARTVYLRSKISEEEISAADLQTWVDETEGFSVAHLRELVVAVFCLGRTFEATLKRLKGMGTKPKSTDERKTGF